MIVVGHSLKVVRLISKVVSRFMVDYLVEVLSLKENHRQDYLL